MIVLQSHFLIISAEQKEKNMSASPVSILAHDRRDNVAVVVVENVSAGDELRGVYLDDDSEFTLSAKDSAPLGHKLALTDLKSGDAAIKYGQDIGAMTAAAPRGAHVHTHNLKTSRW